MPDVYVEVGTVKNVPNSYLTSAQAEMKAAITAAVNKTGSGMTTVKPAGGKGIQVNVLVMKLAQDGSDVTCLLIAELYELPSKQRFTPGGSPRGEAKKPGKLDAIAGACVGAAVADLMIKIGPAIAGSQPATATGAASQSPLIFIAPFAVDAKAAPSGLGARTKTAITNMMDRKIKANTARFTQDASKFQIGSGMPAYAIGMTVDTVVYDAAAKQMVATTKGYVAEHPSGNMLVTNVPGSATQLQMTKAPRDDEKVQLFVDAAESATDTAIKWILKKHP